MTKKTDLNQIFFLDQHGCAKNQVDGELIISELEKDGWSRTDDAENASLIIIKEAASASSVLDQPFFSSSAMISSPST